MSLSTPTKKMAIVCVDDEPSVLLSLKTQLKSHYKDQYAYESADNAPDALSIIDELVGEGVQVILIVSDWLMPGMKGDEFLIIVHNKYPKIKAVLLTGHADNKAIENAKRNANLLKCIFKPWKLSDLVDAVELASEQSYE